MRQIKLHNSSESITVDDEDFDRLSVFKWYLKPTGRSVFRATSRALGTINISIGNEIMHTRHVVYDHIDRDCFNNQKSNLRVCSDSQNMANRGKFKNCTSKYKGVSWHKRDRIWSSMIMINRKPIYIGSFKSEIEAARAYDKKAFELFKEFACLNNV
jgi:hypothetical protein